MPLKITSFRSFQIFQVAHAKISMKQGPVKIDLVDENLSEIATPAFHSMWR
jgi:hypothetical protein